MGTKKEEKYLPEFWIDKTPVTNAEYARFVADTGQEPPRHWKGKHHRQERLLTIPSSMFPGMMPSPTLSGPGKICLLKKNGKRQPEVRMAGEYPVG